MTRMLVALVLVPWLAACPGRELDVGTAREPGDAKAAESAAADESSRSQSSVVGTPDDPNKGDPSNAAQCPAYWSAPGEACDVGVLCRYPVGGTCQCQGTIDVVGGGRGAGSWACVGPQHGCPNEVPLPDETCSTPDQRCRYWGANIENFACTDGRWVQGKDGAY